MIEARREIADDDDAEAALVREGFINELTRNKHNPETDAVFIGSQLAALFVNQALGEKLPANKACAKLNTLAIPELRKSSNAEGGRGFRWTGKNALPGAVAVPLAQLAQEEGWPPGA